MKLFIIAFVFLFAGCAVEDVESTEIEEVVDVAEDKENPVEPEEIEKPDESHIDVVENTDDIIEVSFRNVSCTMTIKIDDVVVDEYDFDTDDPYVKQFSGSYTVKRGQDFDLELTPFEHSQGHFFVTLNGHLFRMYSCMATSSGLYTGVSGKFVYQYREDVDLYYDAVESQYVEFYLLDTISKGTGGLK